VNTLESAVADFLLSCRADGLSPATSEWYARMLRPMVRRWPEASIDRIDVGELRQYVVDLRARGKRYVGAAQRPELDGGLSVESVRGHLRAMRRLFGWYWRENDLPPASNPMLRIRMPRRRQAEPKAIDLMDLRKLIECCGDDQVGKRNRALLLFLADTGARAGGVMGLTWTNVMIERGRAIVTEKGDRARVVPFTEYTGQALTDWRAVCPNKAEFVFCSLGTTAPGRRMSMSGLAQLLKRLAKRAGVTGRVNPHSFRHGFAREYLANGGDLGTLSQLMGHSDVSVTVASYAVFRDSELAVLHEKFSPVRGLK